MLNDLSDEERKQISKFFKEHSPVIVKKKLLEWIDKQVAIGKYKDHSNAVEDLIRRGMKSLNHNKTATIDEKTCGFDMSDEEKDYRIIKLPRDLAELIDGLIGRWGYTTRTEFVKDACRKLLREYGINPKVHERAK